MHQNEVIAFDLSVNMLNIMEFIIQWQVMYCILQDSLWFYFYYVLNSQIE